MAQKIEQIINNAMELSCTSRAYLAEKLLESLESLDFEEDFKVTNEWMDEIRKRCQEIDEGKIKLISGEEGLAQLQKKFS